MQNKLRTQIAELKSPRVTSGDCNDGAYAINELKRGPEDFAKIIAEGKKFTDERWEG